MKNQWLACVFCLLTCLMGFLDDPVLDSDTSPSLPCSFDSGLISLLLPISETDTLRFYLDTGGKNFLYRSGLKKLDLRPSKKNLWAKSTLANRFNNHGVPSPEIENMYFMRDKSANFDGMLGREWFANKAWRFDYEHNMLELISPPEFHQKETIKLHFKKKASGENSTHLPRINIVVETDTLAVLFDTGAQAQLAPEAQKMLDKKDLVATSFINASTFENWQKNHPDWLVINEADLSFGLKADLIVVPRVAIGSKVLQNVEFVKREDSNFQVMSAYFMDEEIVGAIGANALSQLNNFVLDYKNEVLMLPKE